MLDWCHAICWQFYRIFMGKLHLNFKLQLCQNGASFNFLPHFPAFQRTIMHYFAANIVVRLPKWKHKCSNGIAAYGLVIFMKVFRECFYRWTSDFRHASIYLSVQYGVFIPLNDVLILCFITPIAQLRHSYMITWYTTDWSTRFWHLILRTHMCLVLEHNLR